jgi:D-alanyl-D-alanine carboxypeptidase
MVNTRRALLGGFATLPVLAAWPGRVWARSVADEAETALDAVFTAAAPPALAAGIVTREGLVWAGVRGARRRGDDGLATLNDRWHLGSNTKAMTAAVFGRLVRQDQARWAMPVAEAFPDLTVDPAWNGITLDDLMRHRGGLLDGPVLNRAWLMAAHADTRPLPEQRADLARAVFSAPPAGPVGAFAYSNANYIVVGAAIEALTGEAWETVMGRELFVPLGLASAGFGAPKGEAPWGHQGGVAVDPAGIADNPAALGPAGTVHMTLADYARFVGAMMGGAPDWLDADTRRHLLTPAAGDPPAYAAGWGIGTAPWAGVGGPGPTITHNGSNTLWFATVLAAPERGLGVITLSNDGVAGQRACTALIPGLTAAAAA